MSDQVHAPVASLSRERAPDTHFIGGLVRPRIRLDDVERTNYRPYRDSNSNPLAVHPVASRYTDCAISNFNNFYILKIVQRLILN
jgi:hypothetical protein